MCMCLCVCVLGLLYGYLVGCFGTWAGAPFGGLACELIFPWRSSISLYPIFILKKDRERNRGGKTGGR